MLCEVSSWIPAAVATTLRDARASQPVIAWLTNIRASIEEYDPLITVKTVLADSEDEQSIISTPDSAFDEILSQLGKEIYKLDEYQRNLVPDEKEVSLSILDIFDKCLEGMAETDEEEKPELIISEISETKENIAMSSESKEPIVVINCESKESIKEVNNEIKESIKTNGECKEIKSEVNGDVKQENGIEDSDCESTLSDISFVTSTPVKIEINKGNINVLDKSREAPVPPPRARLKTPSTTSSIYDNLDFRNDYKTDKRLSDTDSESTCWSYKECNTECEVENTKDPQNPYGVLWSHFGGFHNSDRIIMKVISQNHAVESHIPFDTARDFSPTRYSIYSLQEVGDTHRCDNTTVDNMTPERTDDGYEPVRDALTTDENYYEEIDFGNSYTDEGCSCEGSVEVESCSISASSEGVGRESPLYANLRDNDAYAIAPDVIFWKNLLLHPFYNDDEEDEWITPEECAVYSREQRPPLVIPRITHYRRDARAHPPLHHQDKEQATGKSSVRQYERFQEWSPSSERSRAELERSFSKANSDSPPFVRINKRLGGSTENLLSNVTRPRHLALPASSSGDSLETVEVRDKPAYGRSRKSRSMVAPKHVLRSPIPAPRTLIGQSEPEVILEGPIKRTKFFEGNKKCRKNWVDCYMTLTPTALYFYKDQKTYQASKECRASGTPPSPTAPRAEKVLPLLNANIKECIQIHTRRYTKSLVLTVNYDQFLLQDESEEGARRWLKEIQNVVYKLGPSGLEDYPTHYQSSNTDVDSVGRTPPVSRHAHRNNQKAGGSSNEDLSDSTEVSNSIPKVKRRLLGFFAKRPSMDILKQKGIYQDEQVFGRKLEEVCPKTEGVPKVPLFVVQCVNEIESNEENMCTDGLYRASGNLSQVQKIRLEVDQHNLKVLTESTDIHVLTGSLKLFFRELKEPLIPCSLFDRILAACSIKPRDAKIKEFRSIIKALPQCNRDTLKFLLEHLLRVTKYSERNRMHTANLAIVFGPTLLWAPAEQAHNIAIDCIQQNHVVEILLNDYHDIFADDTSAKKRT